jgi:hypothetical protein
MKGWQVNDELEKKVQAAVAWFKILSRHLPGGTEENHTHSYSDSRSPGLDLNLGPAEYEAAVLTTRPQRSVANTVCRPALGSTLPHVLCMGYGLLCPQVKEAGAWRLQLTYIECNSYECLEPQLQFPIHLHGAVLKVRVCKYRHSSLLEMRELGQRI